MNQRRRLSLTNAKELLERAKTIVDGVRDQEQDSLDNIPENLQDSERAEKMEDAVASLDEAIEAIETAQEKINDAM